LGPVFNHLEEKFYKFSEIWEALEYILTNINVNICGFFFFL